MTETSQLHCSFCGKSQSKVRKLLAGSTAYICDGCVDICQKEVAQASAREHRETHPAIPTPREIKDHLDRHIIGQEDAKEVISVAVYNHYKRLSAASTPGMDVELEKSNILLLGPSGSGKTLFARTIAKLLDVPFAMADATSLTEAGYVGDDVESVISRLLQAANHDVQKAQRGIVYLDEIDKKARRGETVSGSKDVSGEGVQYSLLKLLEGSEVLVQPSGGRKNPSHEMVKVDTTHILFICGGAFVGIEDLIKKGAKTSSATIGFGATPKALTTENKNELLRRVEPEHVSQYGLIPELVGRLPVIAPLQELDEPQLVRVLTEPRNAITKQFAALFEMDDIDLEFEEGALLELASHAIRKKTGARGLRAVLEKKLKKLQFSLPELREDGVKKIVITKEMIANDSEPTVIYGGSKEMEVTIGS